MNPIFRSTTVVAAFAILVLVRFSDSSSDINWNLGNQDDFGNETSSNSNDFFGLLDEELLDEELLDNDNDNDNEDFFPPGNSTLDDDSTRVTASPITSPATLPETETETVPPTRQARKRPNIIILQPDDLPFLDEWTAPPNLPSDRWAMNIFPDNGGRGLPNIEYLRMNGVQMMQAYTASPMCGTSRYSTITGKMPSRAASVRATARDDTTYTGASSYYGDPALVTIPTTKLEDVGGLNDCSEENLARSFQKDPDYQTAMFGKWHLSTIEKVGYNYDDAVDIVQGCGFDTVKALYIENLASIGGFNNYSDGSFSHNMEWMTYEAISFINETVDADDNFFMYFNPTVPHASNDVELAISYFNCTDVADPNRVWDSDPWIKGMSEDAGCEAYRDSIMDRAVWYEDLGKIWLDDAVGALLDALRDNDILDDTIFLFQEDHGMDTKRTLYEGGIRIPQFVHYPKGIAGGTTFDGLVSTVDIAATMMDFAGITPTYELDGKSWKDAINDRCEEDYWKYERCVFFEIDRDRAVRCGCYKYLYIFESGSPTFLRGRRNGLSNKLGGNFFDLCDGTGEYITDNNNNREETVVPDGSNEADLIDTIGCHLDATNPDGNPDYAGCSGAEDYAVCPEAEDVVSMTTPLYRDSPYFKRVDISCGERSIPSVLFLVLITVASSLILFT